MNKQLPTTHTSPTTTTQATRTIARWLWLGAGFAMVGLGVLGMILPVVPTTVFFILAAACFARSSPRFEQWVLNLPRVGPMVRDYRAGLGMRRRTKAIAIGTIATAIILSSLAIPVWQGKLAAYAFALVGIWYIAMRVPTRERVLAERELKS